MNVAEEAPGAPPVKVGFDPAMFGITEVKRPKFLAVISSALLAQVLVRKCAVPPDGFVIEGPTAGGHNAPPRGEVQLSEIGEPVYTEKDVPDLVKIGEFGLPFWLAGSYSGRLRDALAQGAAGIQVGTAFAFCEESGMRPDIRAQVLADSIARRSKVYTDPKASPTGFPFKVVQTEQTLSDEKVYAGRTRICDLGYLREAYRQEDGKLGYRCPSEPIEDYVDKGGDLEDTYGRKCICNGLLATAGFAQVRKGVHEVPIVTAGDEVAHVAKYLKPGQTSYTAKDVLDFLLSS